MRLLTLCVFLASYYGGARAAESDVACLVDNCPLEASLCATSMSSTLTYYNYYERLVDSMYSPATGFVMNFSVPTSLSSYFTEGVRQVHPLALWAAYRQALTGRHRSRITTA